MYLYFPLQSLWSHGSIVQVGVDREASGSWPRYFDVSSSALCITRPVVRWLWSVVVLSMNICLKATACIRPCATVSGSVACSARRRGTWVVISEREIFLSYVAPNRVQDRIFFRAILRLVFTLQCVPRPSIRPSTHSPCCSGQVHPTPYI